MEGGSFIMTPVESGSKRERATARTNVRKTGVNWGREGEWACEIMAATHACVWRDSFMCVTWLIYMRDVTHLYAWRDSFICVTWLIYMRDVIHSYAWRDSFIRVTWLIHMCDMTQAVSVFHSLYLCDITHLHVWCVDSYVWHDSDRDLFICVTLLSHVRVDKQMRAERLGCNVTHLDVWYDSIICVRTREQSGCCKWVLQWVLQWLLQWVLQWVLQCVLHWMLQCVSQCGVMQCVQTSQLSRVPKVGQNAVIYGTWFSRTWDMT